MKLRLITGVLVLLCAGTGGIYTFLAWHVVSTDLRQDGLGRPLHVAPDWVQTQKDVWRKRPSLSPGAVWRVIDWAVGGLSLVCALAGLKLIAAGIARRRADHQVRGRGNGETATNGPKLSISAY